MITKYKDFLKIYEFHPGSLVPYDTIYIRINKSIDMGADPYLLKSMIKEILNHYQGQENNNKFGRQSEEYKYISIISDAIETARDDGYPDDWIFGDLEKIYLEMK